MHRRRWAVGRTSSAYRYTLEYVGWPEYAEQVDTDRTDSIGVLTHLEAGQKIPFGGDRWTEVSEQLARDFRAGDRIVVVQTSGEIVHIPASVSRIAERAVAEARRGFDLLADVDASRISAFYDAFAARLGDDAQFADIAAANAADVADARSRGRATTRLVLDDTMRRSMIEALHMWRDLPDARDIAVETVTHEDWRVTEVRAPLGVVAFVFEGRPNVFADATGVLRSGNTAVFRIGSDALGTARAMMAHCVVPALAEAGLPHGSVVLLDSPERSAGHALFSHPGVSLAVARGSGAAVAQLGAVARQSGTPVSLHGTGGAWMFIAPSATRDRIRGCVAASLDRKVCNTVNVLCVLRSHMSALDAVLEGLDAAGRHRNSRVRLHVIADEAECAEVQKRCRTANMSIDVTREPDESVLAVEWEWDSVPEVSLVLMDDLDDAVDAFNRFSPQFVASVITSEASDLDTIYRRANAPFIGDGFTRWVDGQYALSRPELGLSNWQDGRLFARGGILAGDGVFSVRYRATHDRFDQHR